MSIRTTADERLESAKSHLKDAYKDLLEFIDTDTWGTSKYEDIFIEKVTEITFELMKLRRQLGI